MHTKRVSVMFSAALSLLGLSIAGEARASMSAGAAACGSTVVTAPREGSSIPANVKGIYAGVYRTPGGYRLNAALRAGGAGPSLLGSVAELTSAGGVLPIAQPLTTGTSYTFTYDAPPMGCEALDGGPLEQKIVRFTAGPAATMPTRVGTLEFLGADAPRPNGSATLRFRVALDPALAPFREVAALSLHASDRPSIYPHLGATPEFASGEMAIGASCTERVGEFRETYQLDGYVLGESQALAGAEVGVVYTCLPGTGDSTTVGDGTGPAFEPTGAGQNGARSSGASGCAAASSSDVSFPLTALAATLGVVVARARKRAHRR